MDSTDLAFFAAVVDEGGVTAAARRLNCVQSNVTARIRALEAGLGVQLFRRNGRGVVPTQAAEVLLPHARQVADALRAARASLDDLLNLGQPAGRLLIGSMETVAAVRLPPVLAAYHRDFPAVELGLRTGASRPLLMELLAGQLDAALVGGPVDHPALVVADLGVERMMAVTAAGADWHSLLARSQAAVLCFRTGCAYRERLEGLLAHLGATQVRMQEFGTLEGIIGGVSAGIGLSLLPEAAVERSPLRPLLALHPVPEPWATAPTQLVYRRDALVTAALRRFIDYARLGWATIARQ
ncbi:MULTISPECIES: LysR family transcriptional regulator [unclassified Azospirillum]|uniref:LysR family transcriptional regulator n=1 Tax=unclassified Azospirillum TaxID=2630922 RepID=UPI000B6B413B|nr:MULTISPECIES: LysR family transcriptional regulator [unclassified Azospirillum]SNS28547.1 DNA-binding transcriptional regulator, LysR family [Azospirillum sp. RU38E]SNS47054.1 DNA-binding transcriptional regulator, LysR family [Azospirillum sp. RU37A]